MTGRSDRGQILILTAAAMIVLLGIGALVVDLGLSWMLRRHEQNAADPAALAAARFIGDQDPLTGTQSFDAVNAWKAACHFAIENGIFEPSNTTCAPTADGTAMEVVYPPDTRAGSDGGHTGKVQVVFTDRHPSFFGGIFGRSTATVTAQAIASRQRGETNLHSLIALRPSGCSSAKVHGNGVVYIFPADGYAGPGGFVHVEDNCAGNTSDDRCTTSGGGGALDISGTSDLIATRVNVRGSCKGQSDEPQGILNEAASTNGDPLGTLVFPDFQGEPGAYCGDPSVADQTSSTHSSRSKGCGAGGGPAWEETPCLDDPLEDCVNLRPGVYYGGWDLDSNMRVNLLPGIYIIAGGGIDIPLTSTLDSLGGSGTPAPILIYNTDNPDQSCPSGSAHFCQQNLKLKAENLQLTALRADQPCPPITTVGGCPFGGMVIWYDGEGAQGATASGQVEINGGAELYISGTIYAPRSDVYVLGNAIVNSEAECDVSTHVAAIQIISWTWQIGGTGDLCMPYDPNELYRPRSQGLVR